MPLAAPARSAGLSWTRPSTALECGGRIEGRSRHGLASAVADMVLWSFLAGSIWVELWQALVFADQAKLTCGCRGWRQTKNPLSAGELGRTKPIFAAGPLGQSVCRSVRPDRPKLIRPRQKRNEAQAVRRIS